MCFSGACAAASTCDDDPIVDNFHVCTGARSARTACVRARRPRGVASHGARSAGCPLRRPARRAEGPQRLAALRCCCKLHLKQSAHRPPSLPLKTQPRLRADVRVHHVGLHLPELLDHVPGLEELAGAPPRTRTPRKHIVCARPAPPLGSEDAPARRSQWEGIPEPVAGIGLRLGLGSLGAPPPPGGSRRHALGPPGLHSRLAAAMQHLGPAHRSCSASRASTRPPQGLCRGTEAIRRTRTRQATSSRCLRRRKRTSRAVRRREGGDCVGLGFLV